MLQLFGLLSGIVTTLAYIPYIKDVLRHKTRPQRVTWFIYAILGSIAVFSQLAKGALYSLWLPGIETLATLITFILSIWFGVGGFNRRDMIALSAAAFGLVAWHFTREAAIALYIVIFIDAVGTWPTVEKAFKNPGSETLMTWALVTIGGLFATLAVGKFNFVLLAYPISIFLANAAVVIAMGLGKRKTSAMKVTSLHGRV